MLINTYLPTLALFSSAATPAKGSLVVVMISKSGDYVVVAAESRNSGHGGAPSNDTACKIVALGNDTLFFETGVNSIEGLSQGSHWDAAAVARETYKNLRKHDARSLSIVWGNAAVHWFYGLASHYNLQTVVDDPDGRIVTGGFVRFDDNSATLEGQLFFITRTRRLSVGLPISSDSVPVKSR